MSEERHTAECQPMRGPLVRVTGEDMWVSLFVNDELDREILRLALEMAERRRHMKPAAIAACESNTPTED